MLEKAANMRDNEGTKKNKNGDKKIVYHKVSFKMLNNKREDAHISLIQTELMLHKKIPETSAEKVE